MTVDRKILLKALAHGLSARIAHVYPATLFAGMDWKLAGARPEGATHSVFQLLHHMAFWQEWIVSWLEGKKLPSRSGNWCAAAGPADREEWGKAVKRFRNGLERLKRCAREAARARRGGGFPYGASMMRSAARGTVSAYPYLRRDNVGFRVARTVR